MNLDASHREIGADTLLTRQDDSKNEGAFFAAIPPFRGVVPKTPIGKSLLAVLTSRALQEVH